ncbi:MAG TPA: FG-GAP-like repeat-containing protein, partial [Thermoanaerobaculia bacterium]|nr:FG-GAP-like repeat-containing protein [Thermoanaerobaculia bacterium]
MGDLNGDGLDDIVFPDRVAKKLRIFFQTKDGKFEESPETAEPLLDSVAVDVRLADIDGDGRLDMVLAKSVFSNYAKDPGGVEVLLNQGSR